MQFFRFLLNKRTFLISKIVLLALLVPVLASRHGNQATAQETKIMVQDNLEKYRPGTTDIPWTNDQNCRSKTRKGRSRCDSRQGKPVQVSSQDARDGKNSLKFVKYTNDLWYEGGSGKLKHRNELKVSRIFKTGKEYWVGYSIKPTGNWNSPWFKSDSDEWITQVMSGGSKSILFKLDRRDNGRSYHFCSTKGGCGKKVKWNQWNDIVIRFKLGKNGFVEVYQDGVKTISYKGSVKSYPNGHDFKFGLYGKKPSPDGTFVMYLDSMKIAEGKNLYGVVAPSGKAPVLRSSDSSNQTSKQDSSNPSSSNSKNLALGKAVTVSSQQQERPGKNAVDGKIDSRWSAQGYSQSLLIKLGEEMQTIDRLEIVPHKGRAYQFKAVTGNGRPIVNRTDNTKGGEVISAKFKPIKTQYVKLIFTVCHGSACSPKDWVSIEEVRVFKAN